MTGKKGAGKRDHEGAAGGGGTRERTPPLTHPLQRGRCPQQQQRGSTPPQTCSPSFTAEISVRLILFVQVSIFFPQVRRQPRKAHPVLRACSPWCLKSNWLGGRQVPSPAQLTDVIYPEPAEKPFPAAAARASAFRRGAVWSAQGRALGSNTSSSPGSPV